MTHTQRTFKLTAISDKNLRVVGECTTSSPATNAEQPHGRRKMKCTNEVPCGMREHIDTRIAFWLSDEAKWMTKKGISDQHNVRRNTRCDKHASVSASNR